jgi:dihydroorotase
VAIKLFAGSSTGNLLVAEENDIEKVFKNASKVVAVHSEDEEILNRNKKLIKEGDVHTHPIWRSDECAISSTRRIVRIAERYKKKAHILACNNQTRNRFSISTQRQYYF